MGLTCSHNDAIITPHNQRSKGIWSFNEDRYKNDQNYRDKINEGVREGWVYITYPQDYYILNVTRDGTSFIVYFGSAKGSGFNSTEAIPDKPGKYKVHLS